MTPTLRRAAWTAALIVAAACADRQTPLEPPANTGTLPPPPAQPEPAGIALQRARHERFARRFALALADDDFRAGVYAALRQSGEPEGK
ncbi:MAG: hypothetical protein HOP28_12135, partial [Gemmatimonadales bacterium]|nr:hypothetical protein [Gemmatimonadales bacterium]